jgi:hypothetical protein
VHTVTTVLPFWASISESLVIESSLTGFSSCASAIISQSRVVIFQVRNHKISRFQSRLSNRPVTAFSNLQISLHPLSLYVCLRLLWQMFPHLVRKLLHWLHLPHRERDCKDIGSRFVYLWYVFGFVVLPLQFISVSSYRFYCLIAAACFPQAPPHQVHQV